MRPTREGALLVVAGIALLAASSGSGPATVALAVSGMVLATDGQTQPLAASGVDIRAAVNGVAVARGASGTDGSYTLDAEVPAGGDVVVSFRLAEHATVHRTLEANASASVTSNATLRQLAYLECAGTGCALENGKLALSGLPAGTTGSGRVFNPVTERSAFPGSSSDAAGNLLVSGVFAAMDLRQGGAPLETLSSPAQLDLELPRETWPVVVDVDPRTPERIEVPLYSFDEGAGTWVRQGEALLANADGELLNGTTDLPALRAGTLAGRVLARGAVEHLSYWTVAWPVEAHACLAASITTDDGAPATGATVSVSGVRYTGTTTPQAVGADGRFCAGVMRSDGAAQAVRITVAYGDGIHAFGPYDTSSAPGSCGASGCTDVGELKLTADRKRTARVCPITGRVVDRLGRPLPGGLVFAWDDAVPEAVRTARCEGDYELCAGMTSSDAASAFSLRVVTMETPTLGVWASDESDRAVWRWRFGQRELAGCPAEPVTVVADDGFDWLLDVGLAARGSEISWATPHRAASLRVTNPAAARSSRWSLEEQEQGAGFAAPVTCRRVPAGAVQSFPTTGAPGPLVAGDTVTVVMSGRSASGYAYFGGGACTYDGATCTPAD